MIPLLLTWCVNFLTAKHLKIYTARLQSNVRSINRIGEEERMAKTLMLMVIAFTVAIGLGELTTHTYGELNKAIFHKDQRKCCPWSKSGHPGRNPYWSSKVTSSRGLKDHIKIIHTATVPLLVCCCLEIFFFSKLFPLERYNDYNESFFIFMNTLRSVSVFL